MYVVANTRAIDHTQSTTTHLFIDKVNNDAFAKLPRHAKIDMGFGKLAV